MNTVKKRARKEKEKIIRASQNRGGKLEMIT